MTTRLAPVQPAPFEASKFPEAMSLRTCLSSYGSATRRFSRSFCFSRTFSRRAWPCPCVPQPLVRPLKSVYKRG